MTSRSFVVAALGLLALIVYLFVQAPAPLADEIVEGRTVPIESVFAMVEAENDAVRKLYTAEIVGAGIEAGLRFDEDWKEPGVEAGPLPALFLRLTATSLEKSPVRLGLFLGSDAPINDANRFSAEQQAMFEAVKTGLEPQFSFAADTQLHTAMFPDLALAPPCVDCHNRHPQSPKADWRLDDVMGATTWTYPAATLTFDETVAVLAALREAFGEAYSAYLAKAESFDVQPEIGERWPRDGYFLPTEEVFLAEAARRSSGRTLTALLGLSGPGAG